MHVYIYDTFVNQKKYEKTLAAIETRITDLGLNGRIIRLGVMKNIYDLVKTELRRGAKTVVAVGDDSTASQTINSLAGSDVPLGIVPIGGNNKIAEALGIEPDVLACDNLSARRIVKIDLGKANNNYFICSAKIANEGTAIDINHDYSIEVLGDGEVSVVNLAPEGESVLPNANFNPQDGMLELYIKTKESKNFFKKINSQSIFSLQNLNISSKHPLILDNTIKIVTPAQISIAPQALNVIVGKERKF